jgi:cell division protein FtsI/penicillin-binding protein 2
MEPLRTEPVFVLSHPSRKNKNAARVGHPRPFIFIENAFVGLFLLIAACPAPAQQSAEPQLFSQSAQAVLDRNFPSPDLSYLLLDGSGKLLAERWADPAPVSPGSLVKPFLAIAYGEQHEGRFPTVRCRGTESRCWLPRGHGNLGLEEAIAQSCNAYFLELAAGLDHRHAAQTLARYGLTAPPMAASAESLAGLGSAWKEPPMGWARAYLQLVNEQQSPVQSRIVKGMLDSAERGTAHAVDAALGRNAALAKTGTAACSHTPRGAADGFTVILYPAAQPRLLLLVRVHGVTGAESAKVAGAMIRSLGGGEL